MGLFGLLLISLLFLIGGHGFGWSSTTNGLLWSRDELLLGCFTGTGGLGLTRSSDQLFREQCGGYILTVALKLDAIASLCDEADAALERVADAHGLKTLESITAPLRAHWLHTWND